MSNIIIKDLRIAKAYYAKNKRVVIKLLFTAFIFLFIAMAIVGFRVLYPYHFLLSIPFLVLGVRYLLSSFLLNKNKVTRSKTFIFIKKIVTRYEKIIFIVAIIWIILYVFSRVLPTEVNPFVGMRDEEITLFVDQSVDASVVLLDRLETAGNELIDSGLLEKKTLTNDEVADLHLKWEQFLHSAKDSEDMTDIHRYFGKISYFSMPDEHAKSFVVSYTLYMKKFEFFGRIIDLVENNERVAKVLNEYSTAFGAKNSYFNIRDRHVGHETLLRRNMGRAYELFLEKTVNDDIFGQNYMTLKRENKKSFMYLTTHVGDTIDAMALKLGTDVESGLFNSWFPIQKNVANTLGNIKVSQRHESFITHDQIVVMKQFLQPGDIFVERRNWYASNVGIPGFWPHAALYIGTVDEANKFFEGLFPRNDYHSFIDFIKAKYPSLYEKYQSKDDAGFAYAMIEGQAPGIILLSLEESASADYVGVLRPRLGKEDILMAILRAFENYGKPYDYNFDFETRDEIVCSELVYDAYLPYNEKNGISFNLSVTSGRKMVSPNDMVKKFYDEKGTNKQQLDFVYFIDGNESLKKAFVKDEESFITSWTRPKFSTFQE